ncbi:AraC family transcriptional regulator [Arthrobacter sp. zg-Y20]|uniref:AraC family transcriptional regulator n=1 Tax=unclassified Arthrobacter TaxID=235627 RepID=UPI001D15D6E5|nr:MULTISPECIES: AraC family transcriptional regulator [unclassified Arthrobacter]MCC3275389.1 AraC family transcriptional regulator [Arthrobacter sp. zg-Y20]MDK1315548.1 AraC family transcriptional regulator [Arthrobacter sp. zg.Y20]WIB05963.1 AraC family transcriptional regulator [Arthrobacter sp. zg-Y20]
MANDRLSEVLDFIEVRGIISGSTAVHGRWESESLLEEDLKFFAVVQGSMRVSTNGAETPLLLEAGEVAVLNGRTWLRLEGCNGGGAGEGPGDSVPVRLDPPASGTFVRVGEGEPGEEDIIIGGRIAVNDAGRELLLQALPPVAHIRSGSAAAPHMHGLMERLFAEVSNARMGSEFAVRQYGQLLLVDVLRAFLEEAELPSGWLKLLTDDRLRPAVALIHSRPDKPWSLEELARAAAMSRTAFAERFREVAGTPPRTYLNNWRMLVAQRELRSGDVRIRSLALDLGFSSESSFSTAFKRSIGESPLRYRTRMRGLAASN